MRRRPRRSASGTLPAEALSPLLRTIALLIVLGLIYSWAKNPRSWNWLDNGADATSASLGAQSAKNPVRPGNAETRAQTSSEIVVPGPTDQDPQEAASARNLFEAVSDREPLSAIEMPAYWRCLRWARAQSFADLERRAAKTIAYTQLWEQPDKYRGKLVRLRLHLRRILEWPAPENSVGVKRVYDASGFTEESKSYPYIVVFSELPAGMNLGENVQEEGLFVGYFLKTMKYTAYNKNYSAPLLVGRMQRAGTVANDRPIVGGNDWIWLCAIGGPLVLLMFYGVWMQRHRFERIRKMAAAAPTDEAEMENWFRNGAVSPSDGPASSDVPPPEPPFSG